MYKHYTKVVAAFIAVGLCAFGYQATHAASETADACDSQKSAWCIAPRLDKTTDILASATIPKLATPAWMAPPTPVAAPAEARVVTYSVSTRGEISADVDEFKTTIASTLNDPRGWTRLGVSFSEVETGGQFTVFMSEASQMTSFSATSCDTTYSCNVGRAVIINQDRWLNGAPSWMGAGGDLASYRQMVINHETGHWLGHGHRMCSAAGQAAPVMQQQSMGMQGCTPNAWPLPAELYSPTLGIRS